MDIDTLVRKAKRGDGNAFWELIEHKKSSLYRMAFWYAKNESAAMDIVSESVYKAYVSLPKLKNNDFFHTWLTRILIHCAYDYLKKNNLVSLTRTEYPAIADGDYKSDKAETIMDLYNALNTLDEKHRAVVVLKYLEDMTINQVSEILAMPSGTVKTYLHRALLHLRLKLEEV